MIKGHPEEKDLKSLLNHGTNDCLREKLKWKILEFVAKKIFLCHLHYYVQMQYSIREEVGRWRKGTGRLTEELGGYNGFKYNCHQLLMELSLFRTKKLMARKDFVCLFICCENRNKDIFIKSCMVQSRTVPQNICGHNYDPPKCHAIHNEAKIQECVFG